MILIIFTGHARASMHRPSDALHRPSSQWSPRQSRARVPSDVPTTFRGVPLYEQMKLVYAARKASMQQDMMSPVEEAGEGEASLQQLHIVIDMPDGEQGTRASSQLSCSSHCFTEEDVEAMVDEPELVGDVHESDV